MFKSLGQLCSQVQGIYLQKFGTNMFTSLRHIVQRFGANMFTSSGHICAKVQGKYVHNFGAKYVHKFRAYIFRILGHIC